MEGFDQNFLGGGHALPQGYRQAKLLECHFQSTDRDDHIERTHVPDVCDANNLTLQVILSLGKGDAHVDTQVVQQLISVCPLGYVNSRVARAIRS